MKQSKHTSQGATSTRVRLSGTFTFMHLADAFIQSDLQCIQVIHFFCQYMCSLGIEPTTFALLKQCSTTEPQEHMDTGQEGFLKGQLKYNFTCPTGQVAKPD